MVSQRQIRNLPPEQLPMALAYGRDAISMHVERAGRCGEGQWRQESTHKTRFYHQRSVVWS